MITAMMFRILLILFMCMPTIVWAQSGREPIPQVNSYIEAIDLKEMDVSDVLKYFSVESGVNIVKSPNVRGKVSIFLKEVTALEALKIVVDTYGWVQVEDDHLITVMTDKDYEIKFGYKYGTQQQETLIVNIAFSSPKKLEAVLAQVKSEEGQIIPDEKSGTLILMDTPAKVQQMQSLIRQLDVSTETKVFDLSYANIESMAAVIETVLTPDIGELRFNKRTKRLIVSDTYPTLKKVEQLIATFDEKHREVLIEAKIIQVTLDDEYKFGVDWQGLVRDNHNLTATGDFDILGLGDKKGTIQIGTIEDDDYSFLLEALKTVGDSRILSSPSIATLDGEEAKILVGSTEPYVTTTTTTTATGPSTTAEDVKFIDVGVKLFVTPNIHRDGFITMRVRPEVSSVVRNLVTSNNNVIPVVDTSEAETKVMVKDRTTVVIGGLIKEESIQADNQIPLLGDVPVLGVAFRNKRDFTRVTEIVIFLTPRIVTGDEDVLGFENNRGQRPN